MKTYLGSDGYVRIGNNRQYEHRVIWEQYNGSIPAGAVIHHKNGNKADNRIANLELIENNGEHRRLCHSSLPFYEMKPFTVKDMVWIQEHLPLDRL